MPWKSQPARANRKPASICTSDTDDPPLPVTACATLPNKCGRDTLSCSPSEKVSDIHRQISCRAKMDTESPSVLQWCLELTQCVGCFAGMLQKNSCRACFCFAFCSSETLQCRTLMRTSRHRLQWPLAHFANRGSLHASETPLAV